MSLGVTRDELDAIARYGSSASRAARERVRSSAPGRYSYENYLAATGQPGYVGPRDEKGQPLKYGGYDTQGMFTAAIEGQGRLDRQRALERAAELDAMNQRQFDLMARNFNFLTSQARGDVQSHMPTNASDAGWMQHEVQRLGLRGPGEVSAFANAPMSRDATYTTYRPDAVSHRVPAGRDASARGLDVALGGAWDTTSVYEVPTYAPGKPNALGVVTGVGPQVGWEQVDQVPSGGSGRSTYRTTTYGVPTATPAESAWQIQRDVTEGPTAIKHQPGAAAWQANVVKPGHAKAYEDYLAGLDTEYGMWGDRLRDTAADIYDMETTPLSTHTQRAAVSQFGLDEALAAGWFGPELDVADARDSLAIRSAPLDEYDLERRMAELDVLNGLTDTNGVPMTYDDLQRMQDDATPSGAELRSEQRKQDEAERYATWDENVRQATDGVATGDYLKQRTGMSEKDIADAVTAPSASGTGTAFREAVTAINTALADGGDPTVLDGIFLAYLRDDPMLGRILTSLYGDFAPSNHDLRVGTGIIDTGG